MSHASLPTPWSVEPCTGPPPGCLFISKRSALFSEAKRSNTDKQKTEIVKKLRGVHADRAAQVTKAVRDQLYESYARQQEPKVPRAAGWAQGNRSSQVAGKKKKSRRPRQR